LILIGAQMFLPTKLEPNLPGAAALGPAITFGKTGLIMALLGMFFAFGGAAIENALTGAYNLAQFLGWPWGKFRKPAGAARLGRVVELRCAGEPEHGDSRAARVVTELIYGKAGWIERLGFRAVKERRAAWTSVVAIQGGKILIRDEGNI
jgi:hypothetical protein